MGIFIGFFITVVFFIIFSFIDLRLRRKSGKLLFKINGNEKSGSFAVDEEFKEIEVWVDTIVRGKGFKVVRGTIQLEISGPIHRTIAIEEDNRGTGTVTMWSRNTQRKSLGTLAVGTYKVQVKSNDTLQVISIEIRGYWSKYWLSFLVK